VVVLRMASARDHIELTSALKRSTEAEQRLGEGGISPLVGGPHPTVLDLIRCRSELGTTSGPTKGCPHIEGRLSI